MNAHIQLTGAGSAEKRRELDFYPTPPEVTHALMQFLTSEGHRPKTIWEPASGCGSMSSVLELYADYVYSSDIRTGDDVYGERGKDFLGSNMDYIDAIITNPPFALSEQFITHAIGQARLVAMMLKSQYWHAAKRLELFEKFPPSYVLAMTWRPDFLFDQRDNGKRAAPTMECHWTVWIQGESDTKYRLLKKPQSSINTGRTND